MKITTFNPQIITKDAEPVIKLFEELGFERRHAQEGIGEADVLGIRMKDANGFALDISETEALRDQDKVAIRINVDNFDEAYELLKARGFKNYYGDHEVNTKTSRSAMMISQSGFGINLIEHLK
jgi:hypothetical protein